MSDPVNWGHATRVLRAARNLTQTELAAVAGVDPSLISMAENGKRNLGLETVEAIARGTRCPVFMLALLGSSAEDAATASPALAALLLRVLGPGGGL